MSQPRKLGSWSLCRTVALTGLAALALGCQPEVSTSPPGSTTVSTTAPVASTQSRTTGGGPAADPAAATTAQQSDDSAGPLAASADAAAVAGAAGAAKDAKESTDAPKPPVRPVSRRPAVPGEPLEISFDDLVIGMQADIVYRPWMLTDRAKEIDGQKVRLVGYVHPGVDKQKHIKELVLLRNVECKFGPGGQADHLVMVRFKPGVEATFTKNAVEVQGVLKINPWQGADGNTWSIYDLDGSGFKDLRRK